MKKETNEEKELKKLEKELGKDYGEFAYPEPTVYLPRNTQVLYSGRDFCVLGSESGKAFAVFMSPLSKELEIRPL